MAGVGGGKDAKTENVCNHQRRIAGTIHAIVGELIGREPLLVKGMKTGLIAKEGTRGHGHAPRKQGFDGGIEPDDRDILRFQKLRSAGLGVGAAAKRNHGRFAEFERSSESGPELCRFEQAKGWLAVALEKFCDTHARGVLDAVIQIDETPSEVAGELRPDGSLAGAHESSESDDGRRENACHAKSLVESKMGRKEWVKCYSGLPHFGMANELIERRMS